MPMYRKKPVEVELTQWFPGVQHPGVFGEGDSNYPPYVITIHGQRCYLTAGDWIAPEPKPCRYYPIKPEVFDATYEPVSPPTRARETAKLAWYEAWAAYYYHSQCNDDAAIDAILAAFAHPAQAGEDAR